MKILKFSASWCMPCKALSANITRLTFDEQNMFEEIDIDTPEAKELVAKYGVRAVPTMVVLSDEGSVLRTVTGVQIIPKLRELLELK